MGNSNSNEKPKEDKNNPSPLQLQIRNCIRDVRGNINGSFADLHPGILGESSKMI